MVDNRVGVIKGLGIPRPFSEYCDKFQYIKKVGQIRYIYCIQITLNQFGEDKLKLDVWF